jgi:type III secretion protein U
MKEKTEKPTPKRLRDARKKGQIAKSKEIATCAVIVGMFGYIWLFFDDYMAHISRMVLLPVSYYKVPFDQALVECCKGVGKELIFLSVPFALAAMVIAVLAYLIQFGLVFSTDQITPDIKKINPVEGFKRIFSVQNLFELIKSLLKIVLITSIIYLLLQSSIRHLVDLPNHRVETTLFVLASILKKLVLYISSVFILFAILDYFLQKRLFLRKLKMSLDEIKQERKDREGDPQIKRKRRQLHRDFIEEDMFKTIRDATVIITYSNQIAVALYYQYGEVLLPVVLLKGRQHLAQKMIGIARKFDIPLFNDPYLARKIFKEVAENSHITGDMIDPVANILRSLTKSPGPQIGT